MRKNQKAAAVLLLAAAAALASCAKTEQTDVGAENKITWWIANNATPVVKSYDEIKGVQAIEKKLGVDIQFIHPSKEQETEQFNIMAASGDFADIVSYNWNGYTGGPVKAVADGAIIALDDYIKNDMPNFSKIMAENPMVDYISRGYDGTICVLPSLSDDIVTKSVFGPQIRKDWLDKLGLEVPTSIEDWYKVLTAFKNDDPNGNGEADEVPFVADGTATFLRFSRAFGGVSDEFYVDGNGKVKFGFIENDYKDFLTEIHKWYSEGLIDSEYASANSSMIDSKMMTDVGGSYIGYAGGGMGKYIAASRKTNPNYSLVGAPWPTHNGGAAYSGDPHQLSIGVAGVGMAISAKAKNVDKCLEVIDFMYGDEGSMLMNWGIEGESYDKTADGFKYKDTILHNPDGKSPVEAICEYAPTQYSFVLMRSDAFVQLNSAFDEQAQAMKTWSEADLSRLMPTLSISQEEQSEITKVMDDIYTYRQECINKFVMGVEPLEKWDDAVAKIKSMGIDRAIEVYQTAYDRYLSQSR